MSKPSYKHVGQFFRKIKIWILLCGSLPLLVAGQHTSSDLTNESTISSEYFSTDSIPMSAANHGRIIINVTAGYDWTDYPVITGSGTIGNPYIIKDLVIDAQGTGSAIKISSRSEFAVIRNCSTYNSGHLYSPNHDSGILLETTQNVNITNCSAYNNQFGIYLYFSSHCEVTHNQAFENDYGISIFQSPFTITEDNTAYNNMGYGFKMGYESTNNTFSGNIGSNNTMQGLELEWVNDIKFLNNSIKSNVGNSVHLWYCENDTFLGNTFEGEFYISGTNNTVWDNGTHGNYWFDYEVRYPSATNDGTIWDTPYQIDDNNSDYYPLVNSPHIPSTDTSPTDTPTDTLTDTPIDTGEESSKPIDPVMVIVGIALLISISFVAVKKMVKKEDSDDDFSIDFEPAKQKRTPKKPVPDLPEQKSYIYDPDEPRLK